MDRYEDFDERARRSMALANQEAQRFNHEYIGAEHILLGLVKEGSNSAAELLAKLGASLHNVRRETEKLLKPGPEMVTMGRLPLTPRANKVVDFARNEAKHFRQPLVESAHLLLGLLTSGDDSIPMMVLSSLNIDTNSLANELRTTVAQLAASSDWSCVLQFEIPTNLDLESANQLVAQLLGHLSHRNMEFGGTGFRMRDMAGFSPTVQLIPTGGDDGGAHS